MDCIHCGNTFSINAKFCNKCGKSTEDSIANPLENMVNHVEFLGYHVEKITASNEKEKDIYIAKHSQKNNLVFFEICPNFILFKISLSTNKKFNTEMYEYLNNANKVLNTSRVFYDIDEEKVVLRFESVYLGSYNKEIFGQFLNLCDNDIGKLFPSGKEFDSLFIA